MRTVQTFILRLLVDPAEPEVLRGALQPLPEGEAKLFANESTLLEVLRRFAREAGESSTSRRGGMPHAHLANGNVEEDSP